MVTAAGNTSIRGFSDHPLSIPEPDKPRVCVVTPNLGAASEVWIQRQIGAFSTVQPFVLTHRSLPDSGFSLNGVPIAQVPFFPSAGVGRRRWAVRLIRAASRNFYGIDAAQTQEVKQVLRNRKIDLMLCHFGPTALSMLRASTAVRVPVVAHFHGYDLSSHLRLRWYRWSLIGSLNRFAAIVVVGSAQKNWMMQHGADASRVHVIPCGVPTKEFVPIARPPGSRVRFLAVGRLVPAKGYQYTLSAFKEVVAALPGAELVVVGDGWEASAIKDLSTRLGLDAFVTFRGQLPHAAIAQEMQEADVFVQHSVESEDGAREGFGVAVAEAAASGLPVVATRCGGILDQVVHEKTGLLVEQRDVRGMAAAMLRLARNPHLRVELGRAGRERVEREFDVQAQVAKLEAVLLRVANQRR